MARGVIGHIHRGGSDLNQIASTAYFECSSASDEVDKIATAIDSVIFDDNSTVKGITIYVKFTNGNSAKFPTLTVGTSTTKDVVGNVLGEYKWSPDAVIAFTYDGENWACIGYSEEGAVAPILANKRYMFDAVNSIAGDIGSRNRLSDKISGGTVAWNQQVGTMTSSAEVYGVTRTAVDDGKGLKYTVSNCSQNTNYTATIIQNLRASDHVFFVSLGNVELPTGCRLSLASTDRATTFLGKTLNYSSPNLGVIINVGVTAEFTIYPQVFDLTQMFGSTIADYVNTLETATAGSGITWLKTKTHGLFSKDYYAYSAPSLQSVNISKHIIYGFNAYNPSTGTALILGNKQYQITGSYTSLSFTDINSNTSTITPDSNGFFTTTINGILTVTGGDASDTCVHLVNDSSRNGDYEPYQEFTYQLDSSVHLRGVPILNSNYELDWANPDVYESNNTVTRKYGVMDLGTLSWSRYDPSTTNIPVFYASISNIKAGGTAQMICAKYRCIPWESLGLRTDKTLCEHPTLQLIYVADSAYTDAATFKTAMSGVYLVYELATPTTESASPYSSEQIIPSSSFSTLQYIDAGVEAGTRDIELPPLSEGEYFVAEVTPPELPAAEGSYQLNYNGSVYVYSPRYTIQSFKVAEGTVTSVLVDTPVAPNT